MALGAWGRSSLRDFMGGFLFGAGTNVALRMRKHRIQTQLFDAIVGSGKSGHRHLDFHVLLIQILKCDRKRLAVLKLLEQFVGNGAPRVAAGTVARLQW